MVIRGGQGEAIDRTGNAVAETHKVRCADADAGDIARFACASSDQRRKSFAMLGSLNPLEAAQAMFRASGPAMNASTPRASRPIGDEALPSEA